MPLVRPERKKFLAFAGLILIQFIFISLQVPLGEKSSYLERGVFFLLSPFQHGVQAVGGALGRVWDRYIYLRRVEAQNQSLRDEVFHLRQENLRLRGGLNSLAEKESVSRLMASAGRSFYVASVIGVDAANASKSVIIDKGRSDGLIPDLAVLDAEGRLVGRTIEPLAYHEATVELITNENCSVGVVCGKSQFVGILAGESSKGLCRLKYVLSTNADLSENDEVFTSGYDRIFPRGIPAGRVLSVQKTNGLFKTVLVRPYLELQRLTTVAVLKAEAR